MLPSMGRIVSGLGERPVLLTEEFLIAYLKSMGAGEAKTETTDTSRTVSSVNLKYLSILVCRAHCILLCFDFKSQVHRFKLLYLCHYLSFIEYIICNMLLIEHTDIYEYT